MTLMHPSRVRSFVVVGAMVALVHLDRADAQPQRRGLPAPSETIVPSDPVEVTMHRFYRLPAVDVHIDGSGPFRLVVDTGAAGVVLKSDVAKKLDLKSPPGMPPGMHVQVASPGNTNIPATLLHIDSLKMGSAEFRGIWTVSTELPFGDDVDGVIGTNVFHKCLLTYDYAANRIRLSQGALPKANGRDILSFSSAGGSGSHPIIELEIGGQRAEFLVDTGMRGWVMLPYERAEQLGLEAGPVAGGMALFVGGSRRQRVGRLGTSVRFGQYTVDRPTVFLNDATTGASLGPGMVLGTMALEHFVVTFDARNSLVRFARDSTAPITAPALRSLGVGMRKRGETMEVWDVHPESHAKSLGIKEGDLVYEINGQPAVGLFGTSDWYDLVQSTTAVKLRYASQNERPPRTVDVKILELLPGVGK